MNIALKMYEQSKLEKESSIEELRSKLDEAVEVYEQMSELRSKLNEALKVRVNMHFVHMLVLCLATTVTANTNSLLS